MNTCAARFDDPELRTQFANLQKHDKVVNSRQDSVSISARRCFENDDALRALWREAQHMTEIVVQCDERAAFRGASDEQVVVRRADQLLCSYRLDVVSGPAQQFSPALADVLVELESHAAWTVGTGTIRSRATSAP